MDWWGSVFLSILTCHFIQIGAFLIPGWAGPPVPSAAKSQKRKKSVKGNETIWFHLLIHSLIQVLRCPPGALWLYIAVSSVLQAPLQWSWDGDRVGARNAGRRRCSSSVGDSWRWGWHNEACRKPAHHKGALVLAPPLTHLQAGTTTRSSERFANFKTITLKVREVDDNTHMQQQVLLIYLIYSD